MVKAGVLLAVFSIALSGVAHGQGAASRVSPFDVRDSERHEATPRSAVREASLSLQQPVSAVERQQWEGELFEAKRRVTRSTWIILAGAASLGLGALTTAYEKETGLQTVSTGGMGTDTLFYAVGGGLLGYGVWDRSHASGRVRDLEAQGRQKGFAMRVTPSGVMASYRAAF